MTVWGWVFMVTSVSFVTVLIVWCYAKVLRGGDKGGPERTEDDYAIRGVRWESQRREAQRPRSNDGPKPS